MAYSFLEIISGFFLIMYIVGSIIIGIKIILKYKIKEKKVFITIGLVWILLATPHIMDLLGFIFKVFDHTDYLPNFDRFITPYTIPIAIICWIYSFITLVYPSNKKQKLFLFFLALSIIYMAFNTILMIIEFSLSINLQEFYGEIEVIFLLFSALVFLVSGFIFCYKSFDSLDLRIKVKGIFLLSAFVLYIAAALLLLIGFPLALGENVIYNFCIRLFLLVPSTIFYYLGFFLPKKFENMIIVRKETESPSIKEKTN